MDVDGCVLAAGRAVLDLMERDWQPLSTVELDQRLDQAVEDVLEADLVHKVKRTSESPSRNDAATASSSTREEVSEEVREDNEAVNVRAMAPCPHIISYPMYPVVNGWHHITM